MKATTEYMKHLLDSQRLSKVQQATARNQRSDLQRMHDLGLEPRREQESLPAWAEAFHEKLQRYFYGGIEAEHAPTVG